MLLFPNRCSFLQLVNDIATRGERVISMRGRNRNGHRGLADGDIPNAMLDREVDQGPSFASLDRHLGDFLLHQLRIRLVFEMSDAPFSLGMISSGSQKENHGAGARIPNFRQQSFWVDRLAPDRHPPVNWSGPHNIDCMDTRSRRVG